MPAVWHQIPFLHGSSWVLVCPLVFKTSVGGERPPGWVRFPHTPATSSAQSSTSVLSIRPNRLSARFLAPLFPYATISLAGPPLFLIQFSALRAVLRVGREKRRISGVFLSHSKTRYDACNGSTRPTITLWGAKSRSAARSGSARSAGKAARRPPEV